jgi:hypothetical protein
MDQMQHLYNLYGCKDESHYHGSIYDSILCGLDTKISDLEENVDLLSDELRRITRG